MATSKEQPGKEQPRGEEVYSNEDRKLIISLLNEYSEKLLHVCEQIDKYQKRLFLVVMLLSVLIVLGILLSDTSTQAHNFIFEHAFNTKFTLSLFTLVFISIVSIIFNIGRRVALLKRDATVLYVKLEKIIRATSQAQEHILSNFVSRIELDLRLADAESALEHYSVMMRKLI
jgi:hypothetical protein